MTIEEFRRDSRFRCLTEADFADSPVSRLRTIKAIHSDENESPPQAVLDDDQKTVWTAEVGSSGGQLVDEEGLPLLEEVPLDEFQPR